MMKKRCRILALVLVVVAICVFTCKASAESGLVNGAPTVDNGNVCSVEEYNFPEVPSNEDAIEVYCTEIKKRHLLEIETGSFLNEQEMSFLESMGYNVLVAGKIVHEYDGRYGGLTAYEFPVLYEGPNGIELWYTNSNGELKAVAVMGKLSNNRTWQSFGNIHYRDSENESILASCVYYSIMYDSTKSVVSVWEYGNLRRKHFLPEDSIYAGWSANEGFIFRVGSDVYAVRDYGCCAERYEVRLIARNVNFVIATDYEGDGSEGLSQPLFLMEDGSIMFYCTWYNDKDVPAEDESNLIEVRFERGFNI